MSDQVLLNLLNVLGKRYKMRGVVMGGTLGTGIFKPEKNLVFFRIKSPGTHRCRPR